MNIKTRYIKRLILSLTISFFYLIICGCSQNATFQKYMQPELLYLKSQPYSKIYVEVDSIEGVDVSDKWLDTLREFLEKYCSKPDGIEIVRDEPILFDKIKDMPIGPASILCTDGPDPNYDSQPAYLHVFFYNKDKIFKKARKTPHVIREWPITIFYNTDFMGFRNKQLAPFALSHEAGHVLGLCQNKSHGDSIHCKNNNCLMNSTPGFLEEIGLIFGIPTKKKLCNDCKTDITNYKSEEVDLNLTFDGPFLIRNEDGYSVASLPYCILIIPEEYENEFNWHNSLAWIKEQFHENKNRYFIKSILISYNKDGSPSDMNLYRDIFVKAANDPDPMVKQYSNQMLETLE